MHDKLSRLARRVRELDEGLEKHRRGDEMKHAMSKVQELGKRLKEVEEGREEDVERHEHQLKLAVIEAKAHGKAESAALQEELAVLYNNHGSACKKLGDMGKAVQMFTLARQRQEDVTGPDSIEVTPVLINLAAAHLVNGEAAEAKSLFDKAHAIRSENLGEDHAQTKAALKWVKKCQAAVNGGSQVSLSASTFATPVGTPSTSRSHTPQLGGEGVMGV